jgi:hypothetical protein
VYDARGAVAAELSSPPEGANFFHAADALHFAHSRALERFARPDEFLTKGIRRDAF